MPTLGTRIVLLLDHFERPFNIAALAVGFAFDLWIAKRPDSLPDNILLLSYLFIAGVIIILLNLLETHEEGREHPARALFLILILQFCFGGLASNLLVLYGKSGTLGGDALFVGLLVALLLGNEFFKSQYARLLVAVGVYYFLLLTYCLIAVPTFISHTVGAGTFFLSGAVSVVAMLFFLALFRATAGFADTTRLRRELGALVGGILLFFTALYFYNIIPPVPLSVKAIGVYHSLEHGAGDTYLGTYEAPAWFVFWRDTAATYSIVPGKSAYCFSAVFAPGALETSIVHRWEYYDLDTKHWITVSRVGFPITGGRAQGYRGFSEKRVLAPGAWRCDVETAQGQLIGRITFDMVQSSTTPALSTSQL